MTTRPCEFPGCPAEHRAKGYCSGHYTQTRQGRDLRPIGRRRLTPEARFLSYVEESPGCWNWTGTLFPKGYGSFWISDHSVRAHRFAYERFVGPIPDGMEIDHLCHNRRCVNPDHLRLATRKQQMENLSPSENRGVSYAKDRGKWHAFLGHNGRQINLGFFNTEKEAAEAARRGRLRYFTHNEADRRGVDVSGG